MKRHPLFAYFAIAYLFSWFFAGRLFAPEGLYAPETSALTQALLEIVGMAGPVIAAFVVTRVAYDRAGVRDLLARLFRWRVAARWWLFAALFFPALVLIATAIHLATGGVITWSLPPRPDNFTPYGYIFAVMPLLVFWEEAGWRGFALPELQRHFSPLLASVILGALWATWHLPVMFMEGSHLERAPYLGFVALLIVNTTIMAWLYNHTRSVLITTALHLSYNLSLASPLGTSGLVIGMCMAGATVFAIVIVVSTRMYRRQSGVETAIPPQLSPDRLR